ncbi:MAG: metallophosphoesterase [Oscillospiraceae bacterium]|nr:metallophosphoesterase [Oscillospiraceae bacterium]
MKKHKKRLLIDLAIVLALAAMIIDSSCRIVKSEYTVSSENLPQSFDGFTVAQLSDIHGRMFGKNGQRLIEKIENERPDIIVISGDLADENTENFDEMEAFLSALVEIAPTYYVSGNHEWWARCLDELEEIFEDSGVKYLKNEYVFIERSGEKIALLGAEDPNGPATMIKPPELVEMLEENEGESFRMLIGHRNDWREKYPRLDVDVIFSGHAHGGIVRLPFLGGVLGTNMNLFPDDVDGALESGRYTLIVSRGLGNSVPIPRFLNNPELVIVKMESE